MGSGNGNWRESAHLGLGLEQPLTWVRGEIGYG